MKVHQKFSNGESPSYSNRSTHPLHLLSFCVHWKSWIIIGCRQGNREIQQRPWRQLLFKYIHLFSMTIDNHQTTHQKPSLLFIEHKCGWVSNPRTKNSCLMIEVSSYQIRNGKVQNEGHCPGLVFKVEITPWWVLSTLKCLILLLNALKFHLKLVKVIKFSKPEKNFLQKNQVDGGYPPMSNSCR
jgi:hypothetical protein